MTLATLPPALLASARCFHAVGLEAVPPTITLRLYAVPPDAPDARLELFRWRHDCTGHLANKVLAYLTGALTWPDLADWLEAYPDELAGIPGDLRPAVGATFRRQRERHEQDTRDRLSRRA